MELSLNASPAEINQQIEAHIDGLQGAQRGGVIGLVLLPINVAVGVGAMLYKSIWQGATATPATGSQAIAEVQAAADPVVAEITAAATTTSAVKEIAATKEARESAQAARETVSENPYIPRPPPDTDYPLQRRLATQQKALPAPERPLGLGAPMGSFGTYVPGPNGTQVGAPSGMSDAPMITPQAALIATAVGVAAIALTLALKGYIDRNRQSNGKVVIPATVMYDVGGGVNAAIAGDKDAVIAAAGRIENASAPGMYDWFEQPNPPGYPAPPPRPRANSEPNPEDRGLEVPRQRAMSALLGGRRHRTKRKRHGRKTRKV